MILIKRFSAVILVITLMFTAFGCGGKDFSDESAMALVDEVLESVEFQQELTELPETLLGSSYDLIDGVDALAYSAGYPADRFAIFKADDAKKLPEISKMLENKAQELIDTYSSYDTSQVGKLENAIIETKGNYVIFIVTDDYENAKNIVGKY